MSVGPIMAPKDRITDVLAFWFHDHGESDWFAQSDEFDLIIRDRFSDLHADAKSGKLSSWRDTPEGRLAEIIILDQFSRNMFRGMAESFACDNRALELAKQAIKEGDDQKLDYRMRPFIYVPFMHSESPSDHEEAMQLYEALGNEENLKFERLHKDVIERFGRYPHRNKMLGRVSTTAEKNF